MYSFHPISAVSNIGNLIAICFMLSVLLICIGWAAYDSIMSKGLGYSSTAAIVSYLFIIYLGYWVITDYKEAEPPKNQKVSAEFVDFVAEGYTTVSGKQATRKDVSITYVKYRLMDNSIVLLPANTGHNYPQKVVLYKN